MSRSRQVAEALTTNARVVLVVLLLATALVGAGVTMLGDETTLEGIQDETVETQAQDYIDEHFVENESVNTTSAQLVRTGDDVLTRESLIDSLQFQQEIHDNESVNGTLVEDEPITGVENVLAMAAITEEEIDELEDRADELEERTEAINETSDELEAGLDEIRDLQREFEEEMAERGLEEGDPEYDERAAELEADVDSVIEDVTAELDDSQRFEYEQSVGNIRSYEAQLVEFEQEDGDEATDQPRYQQIQSEMDDEYSWATGVILQKNYSEIQSEALELEAEIEALEEQERRPLDEQIAALEDLDDEEFEELVADTLDGDGPGGSDVLGLLPSSYEPGSTEADARMTVLTQETDDAGGVEIGVTDERVIESQLDLRELAAEYDDERGGDGEYLVFGGGIIEEEIDRSMADTLWIVGPLTLLFVVVALTVAYRDPLDIALGIAGIVAVLLWTFGLVGWSGLAFNLLFAAIPILLIGLSIDYAIHVFMRYRERREAHGTSATRAESEASRERRDSTDGRIADRRAVTGEDREHRGTRTGEPSDDGDPVRGAMAVALAGVGVALVWITATTAMGFAANAVSPLGLLREFGIVGAIGIVSTLIVFGALVPAAKVELDGALERRGFDRRKRAFGTGGGRFSRVLSTGAIAARKAPLVLLLVVLLVTAGGVYGATQVDTTFQEEDFMPQSQPEWAQNLPGPMATGEYRAADDLAVIDEHFHRGDSNAEVLVLGNVTDDDALQRLAAAEEQAAAGDVVYTLPNGEADVGGPLSAMESAADDDESFNESFHAADTTGDGVPDRNVKALYDELFEVDEAAASEVLHRTDDGEYEAVRLIVAVEGDAAYAETAAEMRAIAATLDDGEGDVDEALAVTDGETDGWTAIATGSPVVNHTIEADLFDTVIEGLVVAFVGAVTFLTVAFRATGKGATLGAVTLLPIVLAVAWILGTMYLLGIPFNVLTVTVAALTIGLGVDYSIHVSERYTLELDRQGNVWSAMHTTVTGTGGALLGSAVTTICAFATLGLGVLPVFRQFGVVTGLTVGYAFLASVVVLPTLLVLWTRYLGPDVSFEWTGSQAPAPEEGGPGDQRPGDD